MRDEGRVLWSLEEGHRYQCAPGKEHWVSWRDSEGSVALVLSSPCPQADFKGLIVIVLCQSPSLQSKRAQRSYKTKQNKTLSKVWCQESSVSSVNRLRPRLSRWFDSLQRQEACLFFRARKPPLRLTQPPIQWTPAAISPGVKADGA